MAGYGGLGRTITAGDRVIHTSPNGRERRRPRDGRGTRLRGHAFWPAVARATGVTYLLRSSTRWSRTMTATPSQFWDDLATDLEDPEFLREYVRESVRIATIDDLVNELDE